MRDRYSAHGLRWEAQRHTTSMKAALAAAVLAAAEESKDQGTLRECRISVSESKSQQHLTLGGQRANRHRLVFGGGEPQWLPAGVGVTEKRWESGGITTVWTAPTCRSFPTGRHVGQWESGNMFPQSEMEHVFSAFQPFCLVA